MRQRIKHIIESKVFTYTIILLIVANAIVLGLETTATGSLYDMLHLFDKIFLTIFVMEILLKLYAYRLSFFQKGWNIFDFVIVSISLLPMNESLNILKALRILRVLRLISQIPALRRVVDGFFHAMHGLSAVFMLLMIIFYISAVMAVNLFGEQFPQWFGSVGAAMYSLFQIMTLESWSMGIVRPVMEVYPHAWMFFVPFILITTFSVLNLLIGIVVNSMQVVQEKETNELNKHLNTQDMKTEHIESKLARMEQLIDEMRADLQKKHP
ncbi:ion transporter [Candidatus Woesearchaeota archaeon]|nr:ion transporter [Candidatus Woesearchaeota archaeon]